ncbi:MAG: methyltransferase domain-containing protein [Acidimicrobiaceae bacterium]|nr:methyltransferase domain-containing protein [Acidimicrobiaceae bacterium]
MVEVARARAARAEVDATFEVQDVAAPFRFADASLGGGLAIVVLPQLPQSAACIAEIRRFLRPGGHPADHAPAREGTPLTSPGLLLAAARRVLPPRAWRRPLLRRGLPLSSSRGPGPGRRKVQRRARSRERVGPRVTSRSVGSGSWPAFAPLITGGLTFSGARSAISLAREPPTEFRTNVIGMRSAKSGAPRCD